MKPAPGVYPRAQPRSTKSHAEIAVYEALKKHLPAGCRSKFIWRQFAGLLRRAAEGLRLAAAGLGHAFPVSVMTGWSIGDTCRITLQKQADCLLYRRSTALTYTGTRVLALQCC